MVSALSAMAMTVGESGRKWKEGATVINEIALASEVVGVCRKKVTAHSSFSVLL
jgi:hypothetical protein